MSATKKLGRDEFEPTYKAKEFSKLINRSVRYIENIRLNHGFPFYKEGRNTTYKLSDYIKWREERRQINK
jgi:hypothetical protein